MSTAETTTGPIPPTLRFTAEDVERFYQAHKFNCGPCALAACLGWTLEQVRPHLGEFEAKGYMSPSMMARAVQSAGFVKTGTPGNVWPMHGLVRIQFGGPWLKPDVPPQAAYKHTHWVASKRTENEVWVYDVNSAWLTFDEWEHKTLPRLLKAIRRSDGTWDVSHGWEIRKQ